MTKKKQNQMTVGEALKDLMEAYRLQGKVDEVKIFHAWDQILGDVIAKHTLKKHINNKTLFVYLDSAALRSELSLTKSKLIENLNKTVGLKVIEDIVFN